jgi:hypothetical protein
MTTPVLIIAYKRYANVLAMLHDLHQTNCGKVYLAVDGLQHQDAGERQSFIDNVARLSENLGLEIEMWVREQNLGPAVSVVTAIDWLFSKESSGVILEDDLVLGGGAFKYFESALSFYESEHRVHLISGSNYWAKRFSSLDHPWSSYPITWGWATWKNRWTELRTCYFSASTFSHHGSSLSESFFWRAGILNCKTGKQDAWDIPLAAFSREKDGITILPPVNLVSNIGFDVFAGNTRVNTWPLNETVGALSENYEFVPALKLDRSACLDESIRKELYRISSRNIASGMLRLVLGNISSLLDSGEKHLGQRISSVILPS